MDHLLALAVAVPLLAAAAITGARPLLSSRRRALDAVAIAVAAATTVMLIVIMVRTSGGDQVYWFAGFRPAHRIVIGIDFEAGSLSAGLAALAALLVTAAMTFSWRYFERVATYYHTLMLTFLAGMTGFCLTGDIFDLFVWFELMGVSAYALTAYRPEERGPIQGALNFAITNSVGAYLSLSGIGLIYGRTGALNMAQIGVYIDRHPPDGLVAVAFLLIISGLLIKSAIVPFHFWLADAHAVAPTPVCVLFSGVMVELGLYGIARVYWSMFGQALGHRTAISHVFLTLGVLTAVVGALFCFRERHVKRLLAFSTISHAGMFLTGIAVLTPLGLAGTAVYVIGHGFVKAALFLCTGVVLHRLGSVNETWLHGRGRHLRVTGVVFTLAGLGLADLPPFATFLGKGYIDESTWTHGLPWVMPVFIICAILVGGAVLRVAGGVFYGLGGAPGEDPRMAEMAAEETSETDTGKQRTPLTMIIPPAVLVVAAIAIGLIPQIGSVVQTAAVRFEDQAGYNATVLAGAHIAHPVSLAAAEPAGLTLSAVLTGVGSTIGALVLAFLALYWRRLPLLRRGYEPGAGLTAPIQRFQSGVLNDYVTWIVLGLACLGGVLAFVIRLGGAQRFHGPVTGSGSVCPFTGAVGEAIWMDIITPGRPDESGGGRGQAGPLGAPAGSAEAILDLAFDSGSLAGLRAAVKAFADQAGLPERRAQDVVIAVHELAANAIHHGAGAGRLRVWNLAGVLHCQVEDGELMASSEAPLYPLPIMPGHGLWVARHVADQLRVVSGARGTCATVSFGLREQP